MRSDLRGWRTPEQLRGRLSSLSTPFGFHIPHQGALKPWREAFTAWEFATASGAKNVRLSDDPPDFELNFDDGVLPFELVDARDPDRRLGDEYEAAATRHAMGEPHPLIEEDPAVTTRAALTAIDKLVIAKRQKRYLPHIGLAVRIHIWQIESLSHEVDDAMIRAGRNGAGWRPSLAPGSSPVIACCG